MAGAKRAEAGPNRMEDVDGRRLRAELIACRDASVVVIQAASAAMQRVAANLAN